jgi:Undecaprenyl-phosphate glucose phosphotransferase
VRIDEVLVLISWHRRAEIHQILTRLRRIAAPVRLLADQQVRPFIDHPIYHVGPTRAVELRRLPLSRFDRAFKRLVDSAIAGIAVILLWPLFLIIAVIIPLNSPGPILFKQKRIGFNGRTFWIFKFRTMSVFEDDGRVRQALRNDRRVTPLGWWLRRTSIDELPQLFNVFRGEMSLVGPRPHAEVHDNAFDAAVAHYAWRRNVKPGITGWAQVNGSRGQTPDIESVRRRVDYDLWYIENWSLWLDIRIMLRTVPALFGAKNAY